MTVIPAFAQSNPLCLWADVGGTFTDCFLTGPGKRLTAKVLSSGVVRGELRAIHDGAS